MSAGRPGFVPATVLAAGTACLFHPPPAQAQEWGIYLTCKGNVEAKGRRLPAHMDLAMRRNNQTALVQRSNVAPVGERFRFDISPAHYSMVFTAPHRDSVMYYDWIRGKLFVWDPDLKKLRTIRATVNRQSAAMEGEMVDGDDRVLGRFRMSCEHADNDSVAEPKF